MSTWGAKREIHAIPAEDREDTPLVGLMLDPTPDTDLQALMETPPGGTVPESKAEMYALREILQDAVDGLDARSRWVFDSRVNRGISYDAIADELGLAKATVWRIYERAQRTLQEVLVENPLIAKRLVSRAPLYGPLFPQQIEET